MFWTSLASAHFFLFNRTGTELSTRDLQKMVQALPQYSDQIDKLSLHVEVSCYVVRDIVRSLIDLYLPTVGFFV
jgi:hypothetical protein